MPSPLAGFARSFDRPRRAAGARPATMPLIGDTSPTFTADTTLGKVNFPADYKGRWVILPPPGSCAQAVERLQGSGKDYRAEDWFLSFKKLPKDQLDLPKQDK